MSLFTTSYIPGYCDKNLKWYEKTYHWYTLRTWEDFEKIEKNTLITQI